MRFAPLLLAALALAGCGEALFGGCGPHDTLEWRDASLYDALAGVDHQEEPVPPGLASADALGFEGGSVVRALQWAPPAASRNERETARASLDATTVAVDAPSDAEARALLQAFLANLSVEDAPTRAAMVEAALANRSEALGTFRDGEPVVVLWRSATQPRGAWRVEELARELAPGARSAFATAGTARVEAGSYAFLVALPVRAAELDGIPIAVDAAGHAQATPGERPEGATQEESVERVRAALRARGLPAPEDPGVRTAIC